MVVCSVIHKLVVPGKLPTCNVMIIKIFRLVIINGP